MTGPHKGDGLRTIAPKFRFESGARHGQPYILTRDDLPKVRKLLRADDATLQSVAEAIGVHPQTVSKFLKRFGLRAPKHCPAGGRGGGLLGDKTL